MVERLPSLRIDGVPARAHTQGLEVVEGHYWVTARRDDVNPRQALLLRTHVGADHWDVWRLSLPEEALDHPGGLQSDGRRLWIPVAESRRGGRSLIRAYGVRQLQPGRAAVPELEFPVEDHIGALALAVDGKGLLGASWDTLAVYQWDWSGTRLRTWSGESLRQLGLGFDETSAGLTVQDWKRVGPTLVASGLWRGPGPGRPEPSSRLLSVDGRLEPGAVPRLRILGRWQGIELSREGMAVANGWVHLLPEDLGQTNRVFRVAEHPVR